MRKRIFEIIQRDNNGDKTSQFYDVFMTVCIFISLIPLAFREETVLFRWIEYFTTFFFVIDYLLRFATEDYRRQNSSLLTFVKYPITPYAIIDLLSILPVLAHATFNPSLKVLRLLRALKVLRALKIIHYSRSVRLTMAAFKNSEETLKTVLILAIGYIFVLALLIFNIEIENDNMKDFTDALYFAAVSLTTVGYGDISPETGIGRLITIVSSLVGIAIIALPSGILTAGYIKAVEDENERIRAKRKKKNACRQSAENEDVK